MSSQEPLWYCHECHAEMRPLMQPDPHCALCHGTFVETIENPQDDPREFDHGGPEDFEDMPGIPPILMGLLSGMAGAPRAPQSPPLRPNGTRSAPGSPPTGTGFRFEMTSGFGPNSRTFVFGGPNTLGRDSPAPPEIPNFMRRVNEPRTPGVVHDINGTMMAQYLTALLGRGLGGRGDPLSALLGGGGGAGSGRWGDYAFTQEALDQIVSELMENSNSHRPVGASEEVMDKLPREVLEGGSPLLEKDCAVCKEQFTLETEDPDEQIVVTLPCKHPFHQPCIVPWLKTSATCPVCRYALVPQPEQHPTPGSSNVPPHPSPGNAPVGGGSGILGSLLDYIRPINNSMPNEGGSSQSNNNQGGNNSSSTTDDRNPNVPGGWRDS